MKSAKLGETESDKSSTSGVIFISDGLREEIEQDMDTDIIGKAIRVWNEEKENYTVGKTWYKNEEIEENKVWLDEESQKEIGYSEDLYVEKIDGEDVCQTVTIQPPEDKKVKNEQNVKESLSNKLDGDYVYENKIISQRLNTSVGSKKIEFEVTDVTGTSSDNDNNVVLYQDQESEITIETSNSTESKPAPVQRDNIHYEDIGGLHSELEKVREMIELPIKHPKLFENLGISTPNGVLLYGPPGTGKTMIAKAIANETNATFKSISGPEIISKYYGESEEELRRIFEEARENEPAVIFMDEIDSIATQRSDVKGDVEKRVVAQLLTLMDGLNGDANVIVIGATNRIDAIDPALRRGGRFDREIEIGVPSREEREEILQVHTRDMPLDSTVDISDIAEDTHGFVGADIESLCKESALNSLRRNKKNIEISKDEIDVTQLENISIVNEDIQKAINSVEPSALREVFVEIPEISWDDVGGLNKAKKELKRSVQWPLEHNDVYDAMNVSSSCGILLYGPPGTGKTLLAKSVANESKSNFISIKGPELLNKYVGESEKSIREIFNKARTNSPTVIFFDEIDAITSQRGGDSEIGDRVVSQLLTELDGIEDIEDVVVIATTNRPDIIDSALLRPGRLEKHIYISTPDAEERKQILRLHMEDLNTHEDVDIEEISEKTENFVGADLESLCREAAMIATEELIQSDTDQQEKPIRQKHFNKAYNKISKNIENIDETYENIREQFEQNKATQEDNRSMYH